MDYSNIGLYLEAKGYFSETIEAVPSANDTYKARFRTTGTKAFSSVDGMVIVDYIPQNTETAFSISLCLLDRQTGETDVIRDGAFAGSKTISTKDLDEAVSYLERTITART